MNNLEEINFIHQLYDHYSILLTKKQRDCFELYYFEDLSLSEIAIELNVSRNAIYKSITNTVINLRNYENKLQLIKKKEDINKVLKHNNIDLNVQEEINDIL